MHQEDDSTKKMIKAGLRDGSIFWLLQRHRVYLWAPDRDGERFAELFQRAWKRIPLWGRRRILKHWKHGDHGTVHRQLVPDSPRIELVSGWIGRDDAMGLVKYNGHLVRFSSDIVHLMPDAHVQELIAHELAHVYQGAFCPLVEYARDEAEDSANDIMRRWTFDPFDMDDWLDTPGGLEARRAAGRLDDGTQ
jgi:hypothetical protein